MGFSFDCEALDASAVLDEDASSVSIMGSGEDGADPGDKGPLGWPTICLLFFILLISSLKLLAICECVKGDSMKDEGFGLSSSLIFFSGVQCRGTHRLLLLGLLGEYRGSKSRLLFRVTQAILYILSQVCCVNNSLSL